MLQKLKVALKIDRGFALVWESSRKWAILGLIVIMLIGLSPVVILNFHRLIVDVIADAIAEKTEGASALVLKFILYIVIVEVIVAGLRALSGYIIQAQSLEVQDHVLDTLHRKSNSLDLSYYENPEYHDTLHLAQMDLDA